MTPLERPTMYFIGVTTGSSSILKIFLLWAEILGIDAQLIAQVFHLEITPEVFARLERAASSFRQPI
jgi:shikimate dehydrogenase